MADTKNAFALQRFNLANSDRAFLPEAIIQNMPANQFADLEAIGLVREATAEEVAAENAPAEPLPDAAPTAAAPVAPATTEPAAE